MKTDRANIDSFLTTASVEPANTIIKSGFESLFKSVVNHYYLQLIGAETLSLRRKTKSTASAKDLKIKLKDKFEEIYLIIKKYKEETLPELDEIYSMIDKNKDRVPDSKVSQIKSQVEKLHKLFIDIINLTIDPDADTNLPKLVRNQITILNEIIKGGSFNKRAYMEDKNYGDDDEEEETTGASKPTPPKTKTDGIPTKSKQEAYDNIIRKFGAVSKDNVQEILKALSKLEMPDDEFFKSIDENECLNLDGGKCMHLLSECLKGDKQCIVEFNKLDFSKPIDISTLAIMEAKIIAHKIGFLEKSVDDWYADYVKKNSKTPPLSDGVLKVFKAIKRKLNIFEGKPVSCDKEVLKKAPEPGMLLRYVAPIGNMIGGGNKNNYNNFIINLNALKNNLSMSGGACNTHSLFLDNFNYLKELLKNNGKTFDSKSEFAIKETIEKISNYEKNLKKINKIITGFIYILDKTDFKFDEKAKDANDPITLTVLSDLLKKQEKIQTSNTKRARQLITVFQGIPLNVLMPMLAPPY
jgi:hypothetical protein